MKVEIVNLKKDTQLRRFIDLPKLFELLIRESIFFPKIETLSLFDPFESGFIVNSQRRENNIKQLRSKAHSLSTYLPYSKFRCSDSELREDFYAQIDRLTVRALRKCISDMEMRKLKQRVVCSCWYFGDDESDAMWKVYANQYGVAIVSSVGRLKASLKGSYSDAVYSYNPQEYLIAPVEYVNERGLSNLPQFYKERPWLLKRKAFQHEKEVRISHELPEIAWSMDAIGKPINVNPGKLIKEIVLSPFNPQWVNASIAAVISMILHIKKLTIDVRTSDHMQRPKTANWPLFVFSVIRSWRMLPIVSVEMGATCA